MWQVCCCVGARQRACVMHRHREQGGAGGFVCEGGLFAEEAVALLRDFYESGNPIGTRRW